MRDNRNNIIIMILLVCIVIMMLTIFASADDAFAVGAKSAALYEPKTATFIYSKDMDRRLPMASTTKIMTGLIAIESCDLAEVVEAPSEACGVEGSSIYLKPGDTLTVKDLVYSLLLQSANDAAEVLAIKIGGDISGFSRLMNERAKKMGLKDTHFDNPHGLESEEHYTTAHDLALLSAVALENETFKKVVSTYKYSFNLSGKPRTVVNHNKMLKRYEGAIGVKTGYTKTSGRCLVSAAERDGLTMIAVTLDAPDDWRDHTAMLDLGFSEYERVPVSSLVETKYSVPVLSSDKTKVKATLKDEDALYLIKRKSEPDFRALLDIKQYVAAPVKVGDKLGEVVFMKGDEVYARADIVAKEAATEQKKKFNLFDIFQI